MRRVYRTWHATAVAAARAIPNPRSVARKQHPAAAPNFRCLPERVSGTPICLDSLPFAADKPTARFHEKDMPGIRLFLLPTISSI
jgi:hypothetical protein